jgi:hypothetical protein
MMLQWLHSIELWQKIDDSVVYKLCALLDVCVCTSIVQAVSILVANWMRTKHRVTTWRLEFQAVYFCCLCLIFYFATGFLHCWGWYSLFPSEWLWIPRACLYGMRGLLVRDLRVRETSVRTFGSRYFSCIRPWLATMLSALKYSGVPCMARTRVQRFRDFFCVVVLCEMVSSQWSRSSLWGGFVWMVVSSWASLPNMMFCVHLGDVVG